MFIETLDSENRSAVFTSFFKTTMIALVEVFGKTEHDAQGLVDALCRKFSDAPTREQNLLLHNDPVALASELAEVPWVGIDERRLEVFNYRRRQSLPSWP